MDGEVIVMRVVSAVHEHEVWLDGGKLGPRERKHAAKALHKLANRLAKADDRVQKRQKFIRRFDINGDGNVGPGEMPPALADELRPLDRDGNGWLQGDELP